MERFRQATTVAIPKAHAGDVSLARTSRFSLHVVEMVLAMMVGMAVFGAIRGVLAPSVFTTALRDHVDARYILMALFMAVPMVLLMRYQGHSWERTAEMVGAMVVPVAIACLLWRVGVPAFSSTTLGAITHVAMYAGMLLAMLYRFGEYAHSGHHPQHA